MARLFRTAFTEAAQTGGETAAKATIASGTTMTSSGISIASGALAGGAGLAAVSSILVSQLEHNGKKEEIKDLYKKEIAALLGKPEQKISTDDLEAVGKVNRTIGEELAKARKERNINMGVIFAGTLTSVAVAFALVSSGTWLATTAVATLAYLVVKTPLEVLGKKLFGVENKTTHSRIETIHKEHEAGKVISRERVFSVFVQANPPLDDLIKERFGKTFEKLSVADKMALTEEIGSQLGVAKLTDDINQGRIKASELAFAVEGKFSGVAPTLGDEQKPGIVGAIKEKLHNAAEAIGYHPADDKKFSFAQRELERRGQQAETQR